MLVNEVVSYCCSGFVKCDLRVYIISFVINNWIILSEYLQGGPECSQHNVYL